MLPTDVASTWRSQGDIEFKWDLNSIKGSLLNEPTKENEVKRKTVRAGMANEWSIRVKDRVPWFIIEILRSNFVRIW
jgi:hypothetical protein